MSAVTPVDGKANGFHDHNGHEDLEAPGMRRAVSTGALEKMGMRITFQVRSLLRNQAPRLADGNFVQRFRTKRR